MALKKSYTKQAFGKALSFPESYWMVSSIFGNKDKVTAQITCYDGAAKANIVATTDHTFQPSVSDSSKNFIAQTYDALKQLPEFQDATDC